MESTTITANKNIARQFLLYFEKGDVDAVIALFSPAALYWIPTIRKEYGMTEFKDALHWIQSRFKAGIPVRAWPHCRGGKSSVCNG